MIHNNDVSFFLADSFDILYKLLPAIVTYRHWATRISRTCGTAFSICTQKFRKLSWITPWVWHNFHGRLHKFRRVTPPRPVFYSPSTYCGPSPHVPRISGGWQTNWGHSGGEGERGAVESPGGAHLLGLQHQAGLHTQHSLSPGGATFPPGRRQPGHKHLPLPPGARWVSLPAFLHWLPESDLAG